MWYPILKYSFVFFCTFLMATLFIAALIQIGLCNRLACVRDFTEYFIEKPSTLWIFALSCGATMVVIENIFGN